VILSIQFHTNVSQLVRDVLPGSYTPFVSLGELPSNTLNRLHVCLSYLFWLCISIVCMVTCTVSPLSPSGPDFRGEFFSFFFLQKKWTCVIKKKKMDWRQVWREDDVSRQTSGPPHLTTWSQSWQLNSKLKNCTGGVSGGWVSMRTTSQNRFKCCRQKTE
jgi:hypothetical protein